jgi:TRAP-type mannitol/chloroaromatic compound transport system permease large subunit
VRVLGAIIIALIITIGIPVAFMLMGAGVSFLFGWTATGSAEADHAGSELIDTNY